MAWKAKKDTVLQPSLHTLASPRRDATYSVPDSEVVSNRFVARGDGMSSPGFMMAHFICTDKPTGFSWDLMPGSSDVKVRDECLHVLPLQKYCRRRGLEETKPG